jgi:ribosomal protein L4
MTSSPLWRGGGRIFPNRPDENFSHKVNKKMYRAGMAAILSQLARDGRLAVVDSIWASTRPRPSCWPPSSRPWAWTRCW